MAQQPSFQPVLNPSGYQAQPNVNRLAGLGDSRSSLEGLSNLATVAKAGNDIYQNEKLKTIQSDVTAEINQLIEQTQAGSPSYKAQIKDDLTVQSEYLASGDQLNVLTTLVEDSYKKKLSFYNRALEQGRIDEFAFNELVLNVTRETITKNPGFRNEILTAASNRLEDSGIRARLRFDEDLIKSQAARQDQIQKDITTQLDTYDLGRGKYQFSDGTYDVVKAQKDIDAMATAERNYTQFKRETEVGTVYSEKEMKDFETSGVIQTLVLGANLEDDKVITEIASKYPNDFPKAKNEIIRLIAQRKASFRANPNITKFASSPVVKDNVDFREKTLDALVEAMESFSSFEDYKKYKSNTTDIMRNEQTMQVMSQYNVPALTLLTQVASVAGVSNSEEAKSFFNKFIITGKSILSNSIITDPIALNKFPGTNTSGVNLLFNESAKQSSSELFSNVLSSWVGAINNPTITPNAAAAYGQLDDLITSAGDVNKREKILELKPEARTDLENALKDYTQKINLDLSNYLSANPDKNITLDINPSTGRLIVSGADKNFNQTYTARIDKSLAAYANSRGLTPKEAWPDFYEENFPTLFSGESNDVSVVQDSMDPYVLKSSQIAAQEHLKNKQLFEQNKISKEEFYNRSSTLNTALKSDINTYKEKAVLNNPFKVKTDDLSGLKQFNTQREGILAAADEILLNGPTNSIKNIIISRDSGVNYSENTPIGQQEIIDYVAKFLKVSPEQPIDLTQKETMAKLLMALAAVEGTAETLTYQGRQIDWTRISQFLTKPKVTPVSKRTTFDSEIPTDVAKRVQELERPFGSEVPADLVKD
jgi:hypothetical protein